MRRSPNLNEHKTKSPRRSQSPRRQTPKNRSPKVHKNKPFYRDIAQLLADYHDPEYILQPWVDEKEVTSSYKLLANPNAYDLIQKNGFDFLDERHNFLAIKLLAGNPNPKMVLDIIPDLIERKIHPSIIAQHSDPEVINRFIKTLTPTQDIYTDSSVIASNPLAVKWIVKNPDSLNPEHVSKNPHPEVGKLLRKRPDKINWRSLSTNPSDWAMELLINNPNKISWYHLSSNPSDWAINMLMENRDKIDWNKLSANPSAYPILERYPRKIKEEIALNPNPKVIPLIEALLARLPQQSSDFWENLSANPNAIKILERYPDKISKTGIARNINAFPFILNYPNKIKWSLFAQNSSIFRVGKGKSSTTKFFEDLEVD